MRLEQFIIDEKRRAHVCWWAVEFDVSEESVLAAIAVVGNGAQAVKQYLVQQAQRKAAQSASATLGGERCTIANSPLFDDPVTSIVSRSSTEHKL